MTSRIEDKLGTESFVFCNFLGNRATKEKKCAVRSSTRRVHTSTIEGTKPTAYPVKMEMKTMLQINTQDAL